MGTTQTIWSSSRLQFSVLLALFTLVTSALSTYPSLASRGGTEDPSNKFAIGITYKDNGQPQLCSGVVISPTIVATAAHCVESHHGGALTEYEFSNPGKSIEDPVISNSIVSVSKSGEDLAFIQLKTPLAGAELIPVLSKEKVLQLAPNSLLNGYGFGAVFEDFKLYSAIVRKYPMNWSSSEASVGLKNTYEVTSPNSASCSGDSGGPVTTMIDGKEFLIGVMTSAAQVTQFCGNPGPDGLFRMKVVLIEPFESLIPKAAPSPTASPTPTPKKKKIICLKGDKRVVVRAINPKCPKGYKLKK